MTGIRWIISTPRWICAALPNSSCTFAPSTMRSRMASTSYSVVTGHSKFNDSVQTVPQPKWVFGPSPVQVSIEGVQTSGNHTDQVYSDMNTINTWSYDCKGYLWISSPYQAGTVVRNLLSPTRITRLLSLGRLTMQTGQHRTMGV